MSTTKRSFWYIIYWYERYCNFLINLKDGRDCLVLDKTSLQQQQPGHGRQTTDSFKIRNISSWSNLYVRTR